MGMAKDGKNTDVRCQRHYQSCCGRARGLLDGFSNFGPSNKVRQHNLLRLRMVYCSATSCACVLWKLVKQQAISFILGRCETPIPVCHRNSRRCSCDERTAFAACVDGACGRTDAEWHAEYCGGSLAEGRFCLLFDVSGNGIGSGDLIKILWFDGDGLCLFAKRLERGRFIWPQATSGTVALTQAQLSMLLEGIDWRRPVRSYDPQMAV